MKKKSAKKVVKAKKQSTNLLDKKHRPIHGIVLGSGVYLLKGIIGAISIVGLALVLISLVFYLHRLKTKKTSR